MKRIATNGNAIKNTVTIKDLQQKFSNEFKKLFNSLIMIFLKEICYFFNRGQLNSHHFF